MRYVTADFSGNNNFVKKWQKSAPKTVKGRGGAFRNVTLFLRGGTAKCYEVLQGGGGVNFALKKRYVIFERPLRCSASPCQMTPFSPPRERSLRSNL